MSVYKDLKIGTTIRNLRNKSGYSQKYMYKELGVSAATYSGYETNCTEPKRDMLFKICQLLETNLKDLVVMSIFGQEKEDIDESKL